MKTKPIWQGFRSGELSPRIDGQVEFDKYYQGCKRLENFLPTVQGPATNRPGFRYIASAKNADKKCRLVPFDFSTEQSYILEFGHEYIRFFMNQGQVMGMPDEWKLLLPCDGIDASTSFLDDLVKHTITAHGNAQLDTEYKKFGSASGKFDGVGDYLSTPDHADFDFSGKLWIFNSWVNLKKGSADPYTVFSQRTNATNYITLQIEYYTKLLLHGDGTQGSQVIIDDSKANRTVTVNGNASLNTTIKKFGTASIHLDGAGDYLTVVDHADFDLSGGIWTIDFWVKDEGGGTPEYDVIPQGTYYYQRTDADHYFKLSVDISTIKIIIDGVTIVSANIPIAPHTPNAQWHHLKFVENGNAYSIICDGVVIGSASSATRPANYTGLIYIGRTQSGDYQVKGYIDEYRILKGSADTSLTIPTSAYSKVAHPNFYILAGANASGLSSGEDTLAIGAWHHIEVGGDGTVHYLFSDGQLDDSDTLTTNPANYTQLFLIGAFNEGSPANYYKGWIDDIRIVNGLSCHTASFTPPITAYSTFAGGSPYTKTTTYTESELPELQFTQSADVLFIVHPNHPPAKLSRLGHANWTLADIPFIRRYFFASGALTSNFNNFNAANIVDGALTTKGYDHTGDVDSEYLYVDCVTPEEMIKVRLYVSTAPMNVTYNIQYSTNSIDWVNVVTGWDVSAEGTGWIEKEWTSVGAYRYWLLRISGAPSGGGDVMEIEFYKIWNPAAWTAGHYPSCVTFYEERLWLAYLETLWASKSGDYFDFTMGTNDDDAMRYSISSNQVNKIQWLSSGKILVIGTAGGEYKVSASSLEDAITPLNIRIVKQSFYGSAYHECMTVLDVVLYLARSRKRIREFAYSFENDTYVSPDMTILAEHLFTNYSIEYMCYQPEPMSWLWAVRNDGVLLGFTYHRLEGVAAWHKHTTDGYFESVASIYGLDGSHELWAVVRRNIGGSDVRYIEMMEGLFNDDTLDSNECFFVDSGLSYNGVPATVISGLTHLDGKTVAIVADGVAQDNQIVASGTITLATAASRVHAGLPYTSTLQTMRIEKKDFQGTSQGRKKRINQCTFRLINAKQFKYGQTPDGDLLEKTFDALYSGDFEDGMPLGWDREGTVCIVQEKPLPITVVAIVPEVEINE